MAIYDVFSKRGKPLPDVLQTDDLPRRFRNQVIHILADGLHGGIRGEIGYSSSNRFRLSQAIVSTICREQGELYLTSPNWMEHDPFQELCDFVSTCTEVGRVLDAIELSLRVITASRSAKGKGLAKELNHRFREHGIGFEYVNGSIVTVDDSLIHQEAVRPALYVLASPLYKGPNEEIRKAFKYYRDGDMKGCLSECSKAFESTIKVICEKRKWTYDKKRDTSKKLIAIVLNNGLIPDHNQTQLNSLRSLLESGIPTTRNRLAGHGQGAAPKPAPDYVARYMLHLTASTILMLVESEKALS